MANTSLYDTASALQVIGCVMNNPSLLTNPAQYEFFETDFTTDIHRIIFGAMYELARTGSESINVQTIDNFLKEYPESYGIWLQSDGPKICAEVKANADISNFDYYYERLKKFALLRAYEEVGLDTSKYYDLNNILDAKKRQQAQKQLDKDSLSYIASKIEYDIVGVRGKHVDNSLEDGSMIGEGLSDLINHLNDEPLVGLPLFDPMMNVVTRGARLGTFYLRSAASGVGNIIAV